MKPTHSTVAGSIAVIVLTLGLARPAAAQPAINWYTIDCGGSTTRTGSPAVIGTIGQPDAGPGSAGMTGGVYTLVGGFWPGIPRPCPGDFNNSGSVSVQDIFDFLAAWFAGCTTTSASGPCRFGTADINGSGAISVQDIFDFLAHWFAGC